LTLMNSAQNARNFAPGAIARTVYAKQLPAYEIEMGNSRGAGNAHGWAVRSREGAVPQDRMVSMPRFPRRMTTGGRL
jgi:hypothetical protein